ncbi:hypothetical protein [Streptomyces exfoliatus]|uniref:hypothetical protein n=1 Tax=Streptomyces exfoliatus TaxID=1905 RepID=UPI003C2BD57A
MMLGSFTTTFGRKLPYVRRARVLAVVAATALVAGLAKLACDAARLSGLGAVLLLFSFKVAANGSPAPADVLPYTGLAALGAAVAWALGMSGRLAHPDRTQRLAVAAALRELTVLLEAIGAVRGEGRGSPGTGRPPRCFRRSGRSVYCPRRTELAASEQRAYLLLGTFVR